MNLGIGIRSLYATGVDTSHRVYSQDAWQGEGGGGCDIFFWVENLRQAYKISLAQEICHIFWSEKICIFLGDDLHNVMCVDVAHTGG